MVESASDIYLGLGADGSCQTLLLGRSNRHGLIAGATGTGKTVTLQGIAESFSAAGVPVFLADVKGDLSGIAMPGSPTFKHADKLEARAKELGMANSRFVNPNGLPDSRQVTTARDIFLLSQATIRHFP